MYKIFLFFSLFAQCLFCKPNQKLPVELIRVDPTPKNRVLKLNLQKIEPPIKSTDKLVVECQGFGLGQVLPSKMSNYNLKQSNYGSRLMVYVLSKNKIQRFYINRNNGLNIMEEKSYRKRLYSKRPPSHVLRNVKKGALAFVAVPVTSYNESLKGADAYSLMFTSYKSPKGTDVLRKELSSPLVVYNQPTGTYVSGKGVLLDFYLLNCSLSRYYGYTVEANLKSLRTGRVVFEAALNHWSPYIIQNLPKGRYSLRLTLLYKGVRLKNPQSIPSSGIFTVK